MVISNNHVKYQMVDHVGFLVDNMILGQVSHRVLWLTPACVIPVNLHAQSLIFYQSYNSASLHNTLLKWQT